MLGKFVRRLLSTSSRVQSRKIDETHASLDKMLRVDHAGEYGAVRIYEGQIAILGKTHVAQQLHEMRQHEAEHLQTIERLMPERRVRPTLLLPLWNVAGYALGIGTALLGKEAAMACTVAVEEVISDHYNNQLRDMHSKPELKNEEAIRKILVKHRDDELHHRDIALEHNALQAPLYSFLSATIKTGCRAAIWVSEKV